MGNLLNMHVKKDGRIKIKQKYIVNNKLKYRNKKQNKEN